MSREYVVCSSRCSGDLILFHGTYWDFIPQRKFKKFFFFGFARFRLLHIYFYRFHFQFQFRIECLLCQVVLRGVFKGISAGYMRLFLEFLIFCIIFQIVRTHIDQLIAYDDIVRRQRLRLRWFSKPSINGKLINNASRTLLNRLDTIRILMTRLAVPAAASTIQLGRLALLSSQTNSRAHTHKMMSKMQPCLFSRMQCCAQDWWFFVRVLLCCAKNVNDDLPAGLPFSITVQ